MNTFLRSSVAALALGATLATTALPQPALADGRASTRNLIIAGAAVILGATAINNAHRRSESNQIVGYTADGSAVYGDGHVVAPNGYSWYPGNQGLQVACNNNQCQIYNPNGQNTGYYNGNGNGYGYGNQYGSNNDNYYGSRRRPPQ